MNSALPFNIGLEEGDDGEQDGSVGQKSDLDKHHRLHGPWPAQSNTFRLYRGITLETIDLSGHLYRGWATPAIMNSLRAEHILC